MPPIPSTLDGDAKQAITMLERKHKDLQDFQIPRLRSCKGPLATQQHYASELREDIESFARQVEALDIAVEDQRGENNRRELRELVEEFKDNLSRLRKDARAALLASKRTIDANTLSNREELLRSSAAREKQSLSEQVAEDALMTASNNVTEALQRTLGLMQGELEKSVLSTQLLDASTASLRSTSSTHDTLDSLLQTSKHLITALEKSDWLDRMLIIAALVFFILVVAFILQQRIVNRGLRLAFWWTRFLPGISSKRISPVLETATQSSLTTTLASVVTTTLASSTLAPVLHASPSPLAFADAQITGEASMESTNTAESTLLIPTTEAVERTTTPLSLEESSAETSVPSPQHDEL